MANQENQTKSQVWQFFTLMKDENKTKCLICAYELSNRGGGTSSMRKHLDHKHPFRLTKKSPPDSAEATRSTPKQTQLDGHFAKPVSRQAYVNLTQKAVAACVQDLRPLNIFEGKGMRQFLEALKPGYKPPTHKTVKTYLMGMYETAKADVRSCLKDKSACFTTDMWTSIATEGYITVTAHYLDVDWELVNLVLATREMEERHTGENIARSLDEIKAEFAIEEVIAVTTDNASNMHSACEAFGVPQVKCFAHTLQLAVNEGLSISCISNMAMHARKLTAFFSRSVLASNALASVQARLGNKEKSPITDVCTRWNSVYLMIERLRDIKTDLYAVLNSPEFSKHKHLLLKENHWAIIDQILPLLKVLVETTEVLCAEEYATSSVVYPLVHGLLKNHLAANELESALVRDLKAKISSGIQKRLLTMKDGEEYFTSVCMVSTALDPRYKRLRFLQEDQRQCTYKKVQELMNKSYDDKEAGVQVVQVKSEFDPSPPEPKQAKLEKHNSALQFIMGDLIEIGDDDDAEYCEFEQYMSEPVRSAGINPLSWWKNNQGRFPKLSAVARKYLAIPATSVPSERAFSAAGLTITKQRSSLDPSVADAIIFLNKFKKSKLQIPQTAQPTMTPKVKKEPADTRSTDPTPTTPASPPLPTLSLDSSD